jgi:hypothetical protein
MKNVRESMEGQNSGQLVTLGVRGKGYREREGGYENGKRC